MAALVLAVSLVVPMLFTGAANAAYVTPTEGDNLILADGYTHPLEYEASSDSSYEYRIDDADGNNIVTYTASTAQNDAGNYDVTATLSDDDLIGNVSEGDQLTIEVYDTTNSASVETITVEVDEIADARYDLTDAEVQNTEGVGISTFDGLSVTLNPFADAKDVGEFDREIVFSDADMNQENRTAVIDVQDSEFATVADEAVAEAEAGEEADVQVYINGEPQRVFVDSAPEDVEGMTVVHDTTNDALVIEPNNDRQSLNIEGTMNEGWGYADRIEAFGALEAFEQLR
jgi:hypothetical protein